MFKNKTYFWEKCFGLKIVYYECKSLGLGIEQGFLYRVAGDTMEMKLFLSVLTEL